MPEPETLTDRIRGIRRRIAEAALASGRDPGEITLLTVTKTLPVETLREAYEAGLRDFGENRVQEALEKQDRLPPDIRWHLIGQLQTNKINKVLGRFVLIHSIDSLRLAEGLSARLGEGTQEILLEVNTSGEGTKSGIRPEEAEGMLERLSGIRGLRLRGLMTVGPLTGDGNAPREAFRRLKGLFDLARAKGNGGTDFSILSMGMSGDFEAAIQEGSTLVRVGTALFGERK